MSIAELATGVLLKRGDGGVGAGTKAFKTWGSANTSIRIGDSIAGTAGNSNTITVASSGASFVLTTLTATTLSITIPTTATVAQVCAWLYQQAAFQGSWYADYNAVGDGSGVCPAQTVINLAGGTNGAEIFTLVPGCMDIKGPSRSRDFVDVTSHDSTAKYREFLAGLKQGGSVDVSLNYVPSNTQHLGLNTDFENGTLRNFTLTLPNVAANVFSFSAYVEKFELSTGLAEQIKASVSLRISGTVTYV